MKNRKKILIICLIGAVLLIAGVVLLIVLLGNRDTPDNDNGTDTDDVTEAHASLHDGMITLKDAQLSFGENVLPDNGATLTEKAVNADSGLVTGLYALDLGTVCDKKVSLSVPITGSADGGTVKLGIGKDFELSTGETERIYTYTEATVEDGVATAEFTPSEYAELTTYLGSSGTAVTENTGKLRLFLGFFSQNSTYLEEGHFEVWFPCGLNFKEDNRKKMLDELETMYKYYSDIGYDCTVSGRQTIILQRDLKEEGYYSWMTGEIVMNAKDFDDSMFGTMFTGTSKPILYHEFFHKIQDNYVTVIGLNLWFAEATASYYEAKQLGQTYTGALTESNFPLQFESLLPTENTTEAGYARAALIWYISNRKGNDEWILNLYKSKTDGDGYIESVMSDISATFATDYYTALACGTIGNKPAMVQYNDIVKGRAKENIGVTLDLSLPDENMLNSLLANNGGSVVIGSETISLSGTGARYFALKIDKTVAEKIPDGAEISISCKGGLSVAVKVKSMNTELYGESLGGFKEAVKDEYYYLVLAYANGAKGKSQSLTLSVTLTAKQVFNRIKASPDYEGSGNSIRAALYNTGKAEIDKNGNFKLEIDSYSNDDYTFTDFIVQGKVDFSTMKVSATLSYKKVLNYSGDSLNTFYTNPNDSLYYRCESIINTSVTSGELRGSAVGDSGEWSCEYWSRSNGETVYTVPPRQDPNNPEVILPGFSWSKWVEAGEYSFNLSLDFVLFNE